MYKRTEGVVLNTRRYSEADLIVTYLSRDYGLLKTFAKSPRKIKSRFGSSLEPLTIATIAFIGKEQKALPKLVQSDIIKSNHPLREDMEVFLKLSECIKLIIHLFPERHPEENLYRTFINTLEYLQKGLPLERLIPFLKTKILSIAGHAPELTRCARCGSPSKRFYLSEGSLICKDCSDREGPFIEIDNRVKGLYNFILKSEPQMIERLKVPDSLWTGLEELIQTHINYNIMITGESSWQKALTTGTLSV